MPNLAKGAQAAAFAVSTLFAGTASAQAGSGSCPLNLGGLDLVNNRITLVCQTPINNIQFFSYAISSNPTTAQVLMQMLVAVGEICNQKGGNTCVVEVIYDDDASHNPPGCGPGNCRLLTTLSAF
jgi:hypothetical protein